jgi:hypothetical protein
MENRIYKHRKQPKRNESWTREFVEIVCFC